MAEKERQKTKKYNLDSFAEAYGLERGKHCCYGVWNGYRVHVKRVPFGNPACLVTVVTKANGKEEQLKKWLIRKKKELCIADSGVVGIGLMVCPKSSTDTWRRVAHILDTITAHLAKNGFAGADRCPYCGEELGKNCVVMSDSDIPFRAHEPCFEQAYLQIQAKRAEEAARKDKKPLATLGALLGGVLAAAIFAACWFWFSFGAPGALIGPFVGAWLYKKFGGKETVYKVLACGALTLVCTGAGYLVCLYVSAMADLGGYASAFAKIAADLATSGGATNLILNVVFSAVFALAAAGWQLRGYFKNKKSVGSVKRLD